MLCRQRGFHIFSYNTLLEKLLLIANFRSLSFFTFTPFVVSSRRDLPSCGIDTYKPSSLYENERRQEKKTGSSYSRSWRSCISRNKFAASRLYIITLASNLGPGDNSCERRYRIMHVHNRKETRFLRV